MKALLQFEWRSYFRKPGFYIFMALLIVFGVLAGSNFSMSVSPDVFKNAPYVIAYMLGLMSLLSIFFATVLTTQILFRETDARFNLILYATPIQKNNYLLSRFLVVASLSFVCFTLFVTGFAIGQGMQAGKDQYTGFSLWFYLQPLLVFGLVNTLFCSAILCSFAWFTRNKLAVYVTGLFIYIAYMVTLIYSGSPMMAQGLPQSEAAIRLAAALDPFGISAYFLQTANWSVQQRNTASIPLTGTLLFNRLGVLVIAMLVLLTAFKQFGFSTAEKRKKKKMGAPEVHPAHSGGTFSTIRPSQSWQRHLRSLLSFTKLNLKYITKSIPFVLAAVGMLFHCSMEMFAEIEKGIRIPQKYAGSGLMASTIIENFPGLCLIIVLYYANEIVWRSRNSNFQLIENATPANSTALFFSKWFTLSIIILFFTTLMIVLGMIFQMQYNYRIIDWQAYAGVYLFAAAPLVISAGIILVIQKLIPCKHVGLVISAVVTWCTATPLLGNKILTHPLLKFQIPYKGLYSDMNGFGSFLQFYSALHLFGFCVVLIFVILVTQLKRHRMKLIPLLSVTVLMIAAGVIAGGIIKDYQPKHQEATLSAGAAYEKKYRHFQNEAQPTVIDIVTTVDLFPEKNTYDIAATYTIQNRSGKPVDSILVNFADDMEIKEAAMLHGNNIYPVKGQYTVVRLANTLLPGDTMQFKTTFAYHWSAVNGYQPFNAIVQNGSFMRISRYYPTIGYRSDNEPEGSADRKRFNLGTATQYLTVDAPKNSTDDFMNLDMTVSTGSGQTAIGVGELVKQWSGGRRNYFRYRTLSPIPFRFAVSSAAYGIKKDLYKGKHIEVYYHPAHYQNVEHLIKNARITLDYCEANFGPYPFKAIRFAEISAFTKGFAATAYPATIYMTEGLVFDANLGPDKKQDAINELAGHELSHIWWGCNQISPDNREGNTLLTETLAQYTELMLAKKMYGRRRVMEIVNMHLGIYINERGYTTEPPLYKVMPDNRHISYSKGMVVMYQLAEMIGEEKLNRALKQFLQLHAYPNAKPVSTDLINALYAVTDTAMHAKIDGLFKKITLYSFTVNKTTVKKQGTQYALTIQATGSQYYEDGRGGKTGTPFNDTLEIAVYFKSGKEKIIKMPVMNGQVKGNILLDEIPASLLTDPYTKFIKQEDSRPIMITH